MYLRHFGLEHKPFTITPDPRFLFLSERYREALAHLQYGLREGGGFVLLTGEVGTGKTTLCRGLLEQLPEGVDAALLLNPRLDADTLLDAVCAELEVEHAHASGRRSRLDRLNRHLLDAHATGRRTVLIIDEAQLLGPDALEQVRLLTNLETPTEKLLQVILIGQPELRDLLTRPGLRQLAQRITARYHLEPMNRREVDAYIDHRLRLAGGTPGLFTQAAKARVHRASGGIPRLVNSICDRALLGAYARGTARVDARLCARAVREVLGHADHAVGRLAWTALPLLAGAGLAGWLYAHQTATTPAVERAATPGPTVPAEPEPDRVENLAATNARIAPEPVESVRDIDVPLTSTLHDDRVRALETLATLWGQPAASVSPDCDALPARGLGCFEGQGSWTALRALDRPAMLALEPYGNDVEPAYALLVSADDHGVELLAPDGSRQRVDRETLLAGWLGRFTLLWETPGVTLLRPGDRHPAMEWVRTRLDPEASPPADPAHFDVGLEKRVRAFQQTHGLVPDGLVGRRTMVRLDLLSGPGPRLSTASH